LHQFSTTIKKLPNEDRLISSLSKLISLLNELSMSDVDQFMTSF
jgi:hypothetical protein